MKNLKALMFFIIFNPNIYSAQKKEISLAQTAQANNKLKQALKKAILNLAEKNGLSNKYGSIDKLLSKQLLQILIEMSDYFRNQDSLFDEYLQEVHLALLKPMICNC